MISCWFKAALLASVLTSSATGVTATSSIMDLIPSCSWDTHVHVFDPVGHPYIPDTIYTPPARNTTQLVEQTPTRNYIIVMSGPEGTNTSLTLEAIGQLHDMGREAKGVVVMDLEQMVPEELQRLDQAGVRSVRFNTRRDGSSLDQLFVDCVTRINEAGLNWSIEAAIFEVALWYSLVPTLRSLHQKYGTLFVADHVWAAQPSQFNSTEVSELLELVDEGVVIVKISGLTRYNRTAPEMMPLIKEILKRRHGKGGIFGSDWPHVISSPGSTELMEVNITEHLTLLKGVCDEIGGNTWEKLMRDNAVTLYS
jgi:predicted TIM-barrel fold metal-dependent hydrolase